ncbi:hypothetical protein SI859A1_00410 [Aurantimonas manganoxydans SI85-9A1]|uniref:Uncharacterized protein n=1 Tax=Aurantimonas manganoxydans (strain ATCC BAA-1229 / DSM 21871 / SI85-9A1) TaxID=287752 RepID=Q1YH29_AURMS|nr:hypothetical protein SI859A1_00410 [Aurantimonas manganoxydans SI85-9A1]
MERGSGACARKGRPGATATGAAEALFGPSGSSGVAAFALRLVDGQRSGTGAGKGEEAAGEGDVLKQRGLVVDMGKKAGGDAEGGQRDGHGPRLETDQHRDAGQKLEGADDIGHHERSGHAEAGQIAREAGGPRELAEARYDENDRQENPAEKDEIGVHGDVSWAASLR